jgi:hypothetical protein
LSCPAARISQLLPPRKYHNNSLRLKAKMDNVFRQSYVWIIQLQDILMVKHTAPNWQKYEIEERKHKRKIDRENKHHEKMHEDELDEALREEDKKVIAKLKKKRKK